MDEEKGTIYVPALKRLLFVGNESLEIVETTLLQCIAWLENFRDENGVSFNNFVIQNKLQHYCEKNEGEHNIPLHKYDERKISIKAIIEVIAERNQELIKEIKAL